MTATIDDDATWRIRTLVAVVIASVLLIWLAARNEFPLPLRDHVAELTVDVASGSPGTEYVDGQPFWTIVQPMATVRVANTSTTGRFARVHFRLVAGPCARDRDIELSTATGTKSLTAAADAPLDVTVDDLWLDSLTAQTITLTDASEPCPPFGNDPRAILFQIFALSVDAQP